jgi:hypothetical protein
VCVHSLLSCTLARRDGCKQHNIPTVDGTDGKKQPFVPKDAAEQLAKKGLVKKPEELKGATSESFSIPSASSKGKGGTMTHDAWLPHF